MTEKIPALEIKDTRHLTQLLRTKGSIIGKCVIGKKDIPFYDPNKENLVASVSVKKPQMYPSTGSKTVVLIDCGAKDNIIRSLTKRGVSVYVVPWDTNVYSLSMSYHGVVLSNGPGDPKMAVQTIENVSKLLDGNKPIFGICLGNQILSLAAGGDTFKLKFGHRSQNQPCMIQDGSHCYYLTTQNHGFAVGKIPKGFKSWFVNGNDGTNEGIIHTQKPWMSVQFHPEAFPGPNDTEWIFDKFVSYL